MRSALILAGVVQFTIISALQVAQAGEVCEGCSVCSNAAILHRDGWAIVDTKNFSVWSRLAHEETRQLACACESLRTSFVDNWHEAPEQASWSPKCVIVLHANLIEYRRAVECGSNPSVGCATVTTDGGRIIFRRVDLRADAADWRDNALPHELLHVVLADLFARDSLPAWLNEGLAMCVESPALQQRRRSILKQAHAANTLPALKQVLHNESVTRDVDLFYAVSHSLVGFLRNRGGSQAILQFAELALDGDDSAALQQAFEIEGGWQELEQRWLNATLNHSRTPTLAAQ